MNIIVVLSLVIVFTSVLFMLFTFEEFIGETIDCGTDQCRIKSITVKSAFGGFLIGAFFLVDIAVTFIIFRNIHSS